MTFLKWTAETRHAHRENETSIPIEPPVGRGEEQDWFPTTAVLDVSFHSTLNDSFLQKTRIRITDIGYRLFSKMNHVITTRPTEDLN